MKNGSEDGIILRVKKVLLTCAIFLSCEQDSSQRLTLCPLFSDGMVLQRDTIVSLWGQCDPDQLVTLNSSWGVSDSTRSDQNGDWIAKISTTNETGPHTLTIKSGEWAKEIRDVLFGEVWLAAGQSNMEMDFDYCCNTTDNAIQELANANYSMIRMFNVKKSLEYEPTRNVEGQWAMAVGNDMESFSAVGYFFAKRLHEDLGVPIGIIHSSWGGSTLEAWTSHDVLATLDEYEDDLSDLANDIKENEKAREWFSPYSSIALPSAGWDLYLHDYIKKKSPDIDYLGYFLDGWQELDEIGKERINDIDSDENWMPLDKQGTVDETFETTNFKGVALFRNQFQVHDVNASHMLTIEPEKNLPWGLWEYDVYVNSQKVASSLIDVKKDDYKFIKSNHTINIHSSILKSGENQLVLRIIGHPSMGDISIQTSNGKQIKFDIGWECSLIAEEWYQLNDYKYPYTSLYFHGNHDVDYSSQPKKTIVSHGSLGTLFNGMMNPLIPYAIKGVIWYQGESNVGNGGPEFKSFDTLMPLMINDLRERWGRELPFYFAQIAPYFNYNGMSPYFRDVQRGLLRIPNTGMVVTLDIGENYDIHPSNKHDVGERFARLALSDQYGKDIVASGPLLKSAKMNDGRVTVDFFHIGSGLVIDQSNRSAFELAGKDRKFLEATIINHGEYLEAYSEGISRPKYLRYAFSDTAYATLFNLEGLPGSSFFTRIKD